VGVEEALCRRTNEVFMHRMLTGQPFVTLRCEVSIPLLPLVFYSYKSIGCFDVSRSVLPHSCYLCIVLFCAFNDNLTFLYIRCHVNHLLMGIMVSCFFPSTQPISQLSMSQVFHVHGWWVFGKHRGEQRTRRLLQ
jgi:hypothetical protein